MSDLEADRRDCIKYKSSYFNTLIITRIVWEGEWKVARDAHPT